MRCGVASVKATSRAPAWWLPIPTHYAVALEFSFESMLAPTVLAKGQNLHALRIREEARWAGVPIVENPPLARSLYKGVEEAQAIPYELYAAVRGILAFLYRQQVEKAARDRRAAEGPAKKPVSSVKQTSTTEESVAGGGCDGAGGRNQ